MYIQTKNTILFLLIIFSGCSVSKNYAPDKKFSREQLQHDYSLLRNILEKKHPSLYWYTSKDSMDYYFDQGNKNIADSMTELQFGWRILAPLTNKIHCGHTGFSMSSRWARFIKDKRMPSFPLHLKVWADTMVVIANLNKKDSVIKKGAIITAINGIRNYELLQKMFGYIVQDGYADNVNYTRLSLNFPYFHRNIFGLYKTYSIQYIDSTGKERKTYIPFYNPAADTLEKNKKFPDVSRKNIPRQQKLQRIRSLKIDTANNLANIKLNSFSKGHLPNFFRRSFKKINQASIKNLVIDIRNNGGGDINNFVSLTRYIRNTPFRVSDTAAAVEKSFKPFSKYIKAEFFDRPGLFLLTRKKKDNRYHFRFWEKRIIKPGKKNHFNGNVYVLTNGLTFSASTLFCNAVKGQNNVTLVGEETGGGWHGNSGIMIPEIILPETKLKVRLPFFRLVQYDHVPKNGTGVIPDVLVNPTVQDVRNNFDRKIEVVKEMILKNKEKDILTVTP
ncbi:MAG: peptidase S41 [Chitinophagaceae bacterium]|nr:peptidase S41 [Chitinophagaceae bacterium]